MKKKLSRLKFYANLFLLILVVGLLVNCQKDVEEIVLYSGITISSKVVNSNTDAAIANADILVDGSVVAQTDLAGEFSLKNLKEGTYLVEVIKEGFSSIYFDLAINNSEGVLPVFYLKQLATPISIDKEGGVVNANYSTGKLAATLQVPADALGKETKISATVLLGNELPAAAFPENEILSTVIEFNSDDADLNFEGGADLIFRLPFKKRPGEMVKINLFNESKRVWEIYEMVPVNADALTANVKIYHFSKYSISIEGTYSTIETKKDDYEIVATNASYAKEYSWPSNLKYLDKIPGEDETSILEIKLFLNQYIESYSKLVFSKISYVNLAEENTAKTMINFPNAAPIGNPREYSTFALRYWELVKHCCLVKEQVAIRIFNTELNQYVPHQISYEYNKCWYDWVWRADETYGIASFIACKPGRVIVPATVQHSGGSTN